MADVLGAEKTSTYSLQTTATRIMRLRSNRGASSCVKELSSPTANHRWREYLEVFGRVSQVTGV